MKTIHAIYTFIVLAAATMFVSAQDYPDEYLGLPGDNLNLYAVMNLFQEAETLEKFEQALNSEEQMINNLDLNGDNLIDYITVSDYVDGNVHNIVLRAALNRSEQQDIAVFIVENMSNGGVQIQLIGDEALYGPNYIVEPIYAETPNPGYTGKAYRSNVNVVHTTYYDIAAWPLIRYIYHPGYVGWRSSWYWGYYPSYWRPWRAHYWHYYYGYHYHWHNHYYTHYRHWDHYRSRHYTTYYRSKVRVYSPTVVVNINNNRYRTTYSRPDQRRAGENYYAQRSSSRPSVTSTRRNTNTAVQRSQSSRSSTVQRSQSSRSSTVQRSQPANNRSSVQRSSSNKATPAVQRSTSSSRSGTVQRNQPSKSKSSVQRSQPSRSKSSVQRNQPSRSKSSVQRSSSSSSRKSAESRSSSNSSRRR
ncbi:MAG: hypothetical protein P1P86_11895 [Bacteroidales bacterium]|nr:hypothetical protein [Bacteroidales bacterium]